MKRLFSVIVLIAVLTVPFGMNAQAVEEDWTIPTDPTSGPVVSTGVVLDGGASAEFFEYTVDHKPAGKEGDFGLFPFLGKSFYKFVLKPAYIATKASGKTGGKAVKFFFVQIGHFLF